MVAIALYTIYGNIDILVLVQAILKCYPTQHQYSTMNYLYFSYFFFLKRLFVFFLIFGSLFIVSCADLVFHLYRN